MAERAAVDFLSSVRDPMRFRWNHSSVVALGFLGIFRRFHRYRRLKHFELRATFNDYDGPIRHGCATSQKNSGRLCCCHDGVFGLCRDRGFPVASAHDSAGG